MLFIIQKNNENKIGCSPNDLHINTYTTMSTNKTDADTVAEFQTHEYCKWACYSIGNVEQTKMFVTCYNKCVEKTKQDI